MKEYWLDFSGYVKVKAKDEKEAEEKFWKLRDAIPKQYGKNFSHDVWELDGIEEVEQ